MSVQYISGASNNGGSTAGTSLTVTYSPTAGNTIVAGITFNGAVTSLTCKDQNSNALTLVTNKGNCYQFQGTVITGATSYKFAWTNSVKNAGVVAEYSGVNAIGTNGTNSGSTAPATISVTSTRNWSVIVSVFGVGGNVTTFTQSSGNLRLQTNAGAGNASAIALVDNLGYATGTSITDATGGVGTFTWNAVGVELYPSQTVPVDEWDNDAENQDNFAYIASPNAYMGSNYNIDGDLQDYGVEQISYTPGVIMGWDLDAEQQISQLPSFQYDHNDDYTYPPIVSTKLPTFVQTNSSGIAGSPIQTQLVANIGNIVVVYIYNAGSHGTPVQVSSVVDDGGNIYEPVRSARGVLLGSSVNLYWARIQNIMSTVIVTMVSGIAYVVVAEYSGVAADGIGADTASSIGTLTPAGSLVAEDNNNIVVTGFWASTLVGQTYTPVSGIIRLNAFSDLMVLMDSTSTASNQSLTNSFSSSNTVTTYIASSLDLRSVSPAGEIDLDVEQQLLQVPTFQMQHVDDDNWTQYIVPVVGLQDYTWDDSSDNQIQQIGWSFDVVEERHEFPVIPLVYWDAMDIAHQLQQVAWSLDTLDDRNIYPIIPTRGIDLDTEYQLQQLSSTPDRTLSEENVEYFIAPAGWDNDGENQLSNPPYTTDRELADTGVERITYSAGVIVSWDSAADNQLQWQLWNQDGDVDTSITRILIPTQAYDTDAENQTGQAPYVLNQLFEDITFQIPELTYWELDIDNQLPQLLWSLDVFD